MAITAIYAGLVALLVIYLSVRVIRLRRSLKVSIGDGGHEPLAAAIRAHGNAVEFAPLCLILLGLMESLSTPGFVLHLFGLMIILGRVLHAACFLGASHGMNMRFRVSGMVLTFAVLGLGGVGLILHGLF